MSTNKGRKPDGRPGQPKKPTARRKPSEGRKPTSEKTFQPRPLKAEKPFANTREDHKERSERSETGGRSRFADKPMREDKRENARKPTGDKSFRSKRDEHPRSAQGHKRDGEDKKPFDKKPYQKRESGSRSDAKSGGYNSRTEGKAGYQKTDRPYKNYKKIKGRNAEDLESNDGSMRLNRVLSTAGIASRRDADALIKAGLVSVNGKVVTELGTKVFETDDVRYNGQRIRAERKVYIVMNKPKGFITTVEDEKARKTVMELLAGKVSERVYPVGRLDRGTTGVLMFTNDGDLAKKLTHPSHGARKIYQVTLDKPLTAAHLRDIKAGIELEDGLVPVDEVSFIEDKPKVNIGIELHVGRNRIVRRLFEHLGYEVVKLDRVNFAGLTKKNLERGHWRYLTVQELNYLKMLK